MTEERDSRFVNDTVIEDIQKQMEESLSTEPSDEGTDLYKNDEEKLFIETAIEQMCNIKADEFRLIGVKARGPMIWKCVSSKYRRGYPGFHQITNDILSLKSTVYMNWLLIESQKGNINFE